MSTMPLNERFQLEIDLLRLERQYEAAEAALRQGKFDLREAKQEQILYNGSFKSFRDKLTGRREEAETTLRHAIQKAEAGLTSAQRQKEQLGTQLAQAKETLALLPDWNSLNDGSREWHRLEARYCMEVLAPMLEANRELLVERRNQFNGTNAGQVKAWHTLAQIYSAPEAAGEACKPYLLRLKAALDVLKVPFVLSSYFDNPTAFLSSATQYTRMDRINTAISQAEKLLRQLPELQKQIAD